MDQNLFKKHFEQLKKHETTKLYIITHIEKTTGILLEESEFSVVQKKISLTVSSAKKTALIRKNIGAVLNELGYSFS